MEEVNMWVVVESSKINTLYLGMVHGAVLKNTMKLSYFSVCYYETHWRRLLSKCSVSLIAQSWSDTFWFILGRSILFVHLKAVARYLCDLRHLTSAFPYLVAMRMPMLLEGMVCRVLFVISLCIGFAGILFRFQPSLSHAHAYRGELSCLSIWGLWQAVRTWVQAQSPHEKPPRQGLYTDSLPLSYFYFYFN